MKIDFLVVKDLTKGGGIETYTRAVGRRLVERGHDVTVYSTGGASDKPSVLDGMKIVWIPAVKPGWAEKPAGALMAAWLQAWSRRPDLIHLHSVAAGATASVLRLRNTPCVIQMHGIEWMRSRWSKTASNVLKTMEEMSVRFGDALTAVSKTQCDYFARTYGAWCDYIPTAVESKQRVPADTILQLGLAPQQYVLFAARLVPEKGAHYLIPAFRRLQTPFKLVIAGDGSSSPGYLRTLKDLASGDSRIMFLGDVRGRQLEELFSHARVFAQPSELEGLSIGLLEAMSYGLPCVASDIPANKEVVGDAGLLFRSQDIDDLTANLAAVLRDRNIAPLLGEAARRRVETLFSWEPVVDDLEDLYARVVSMHAEKRAAPIYASSPPRVAVAPVARGVAKQFVKPR